MKKREFLKTSGWLAAGLLLDPLAACTTGQPQAGQATSADAKSADAQSVTHSLPKLAYAFDALEPHIDAETMRIHYTLHHGGYVQKLNDALTKLPDWQRLSLPELMAAVTADKAHTAVRNQGGGHYNHSLFWAQLAPGGGQPDGALAAALQAQFGSVEKWKETFEAAAKGVFGSGWAWLCVGKDKKLFVSSTPNQDNPLMSQVVAQVGTPILGLDVWEHAYYLHYQNRRPDYIKAFFQVINWSVVRERYAAAMA